MTELHHRVRQTQRRLWLIHWLNLLSWTVTVALGLYIVVLLLTKMFGWEAPLGWIVLGLLGTAVLVSVIWTHVVRATEQTAAATLDQAAGLKERISSGLYCVNSDDPFAQAVLVDAERIGQAISVRQAIPLKAPRPAVYTAIVAVVVGVMFLLPSGWIEQTQAQAKQEDNRAVARQRVAVKKRIAEVQKEAKTNPALKDLQADLEKLAQAPPGDLEDPDALRHEALKKIDKAADATKKKLSGDKFDKVNEVKKMLRGLKTPEKADTPASKLAKAMAQGDFKAANEAIKAVQAQLAEMKDSPNAEAAKKMQDQLDRLAKQLDKLADDKSLRRQLEQSGVKKEDVDKAMQQLAKGDMNALEKQLRNAGIPQSQMNSLMKQMAQRASACSACRNMSGVLSQASQSLQQGQMGDAASGLESAGDQLNEMEQLEQEMNQLQSTMSSLQNAKDSMCKGCNPGMGQGMGQQGQGNLSNRGGGMGNLGRGRGGLAPQQQTNIAFKTERSKVFTGPGRIIGQFLIDGEQVKGEATAKLVEVISAEERNATDAVNRDRIPRQYQKSVKEYFTRVQKILSENGQAAQDKQSSSKKEAESDDSKSGDDPDSSDS